jgi:3-hydroxyacyl-[acyl-carrier-protein] dehydratase
MNAMDTETAEFATTVDLAMIQRILPHRYPFLLVDKVIDMVQFKSAVGIKNVTFNEPHFQGHFPGEPIMPGVMIVEALAQTSAVLVGHSMAAADDNVSVYFMSIDKCKFRRKVVPGDIMQLRVETLRGKPGGKVWKFLGQAVVEETVAAEAEFTAMINFPQAAA